MTAGVVAATRRLLAVALTRQEFEQALTVNGKVGLKAPLRVRRRVQQGAGGSCRCGAARLATPSQPDRHHLSCLVAKMILVTYKSDATRTRSILVLVSAPSATVRGYR